MGIIEESSLLITEKVGTGELLFLLLALSQICLGFFLFLFLNKIN